MRLSRGAPVRPWAADRESADGTPSADRQTFGACVRLKWCRTVG